MTRTSLNTIVLTSALLTTAVPPHLAMAQEMAMPTAQMKAVLDKLAELGAKPLGTISVDEARSQPTPADAVAAVMADKGIAPVPALAAIVTKDIAIPGPAGEIPARVYTPAGAGPFPVILYYHGGGWVIADLDTYDGSARALADGASAIVVSAHYRQAPEDKFPAMHEDAYAAYEWVVAHGQDFNADTERLAVAGESAGGNLALNVALEARDRKATIQPDALLLVYPIAGNDMTTESYTVNAQAAPLGRGGMEWFFSQVFTSVDETADPRINLVARDDLAGLPPTTIILAEIDPLRSEGDLLADRLVMAGVDVSKETYAGVTHEFFGMAPVIDEAKDAMSFATAALKKAFSTDTN